MTAVETQHGLNAAGRPKVAECEHDSNGCCTHCMPGMFREPWSRWVGPPEPEPESDQVRWVPTPPVVHCATPLEVVRPIARTRRTVERVARKGYSEELVDVLTLGK